MIEIYKNLSLIKGIKDNNICIKPNIDNQKEFE